MWTAVGLLGRIMLVSAVNCWFIPAPNGVIIKSTFSKPLTFGDVGSDMASGLGADDVDKVLVSLLSELVPLLCTGGAVAPCWFVETEGFEGAVVPTEVDLET